MFNLSSNITNLLSELNIIALPKSIIPQELDKHDYTLIGRKTYLLKS